MAKKYLDDTGLSYFWGKLKTWVSSSFLSLAGGTLTGDLILSGCELKTVKTPTASTVIQDPGVTLSAAADNGVTTDTYPGFKIADSNGQNFVVFEAGANTEGQTVVQMKARNIDTNGDLVENVIYIGVKKDGSQYVWMSCKDKWRAALKPTVLYNNASGTNGTVTLSESAANYNHMCIYFMSGDGDNQRTAALVYDPNGKTATLVSANPQSGGGVWINAAKYRISGTSMTVVTNTNGYAGGSSTSTTAVIRVIRVEAWND